MTDPNPADLPEVSDDDIVQHAGMLPQSAGEGVATTTDEVDPDDMFGGGTE